MTSFGNIHLEPAGGVVVVKKADSQSSDLDKYIIVKHDGENGTIMTSFGNIHLEPAGGVVVVKGTVSQSSDIRLKEDIQPIQKSLAKVKKLQGVSFVKKGNQEREIGLIAQEVEEVVPEVVYTDNQGYKSLSYDRMVALLIEAIKEQQNTIDSLRAEIKEIKERIYK